MTLTPQDFKGIEKILDAKIDSLAVMVNKGFEQVATKTDIAKLELEIVEIKERVIYIERDTAEIRKSLISRMEMEDIMARLLLVEKKLGIKSGK